MNLVKEHINEKFTSESDPIKDLGIGLRYKIKEWLDKCFIYNYEINSDLTIDILGHVSLYHSSFESTEFPTYINFNYISGNFHIERWPLVSMRGFPKKIGGFINVTSTQIQTLDYLPQRIEINLRGENKIQHGYGLANNVKLKSFKGLPNIVNGTLWLQRSPLVTSLKGLPKIIKGSLYIDNKFKEKDIRDICDVRGHIIHV